MHVYACHVLTMQKEDAAATKKRMMGVGTANKFTHRQQGQQQQQQGKTTTPAPSQSRRAGQGHWPQDEAQLATTVHSEKDKSVAPLSTPPSPSASVSREEDFEDDTNWSSSDLSQVETPGDRAAFNDRLRLVKTLCVIEKKDLGPIERMFSELKTKLCNSPTYEEVSIDLER